MRTYYGNKEASHVPTLFVILAIAAIIGCKAIDNTKCDSAKDKTCANQGGNPSEPTATSSSFWTEGYSEQVGAKYIVQQSNGNLVVLGERHFDGNGKPYASSSAPEVMSILDSKGNELSRDEIPAVTKTNYGRNVMPFGLILDKDENIISAGSTQCSRDACPSEWISDGKKGYLDVDGSFVTKWNSKGKIMWERFIGWYQVPIATPRQDPSWITTHVSGYPAVDADGNIYVTGQTNRLADGTLFYGSNVFLTKYSPQGDLLWFKILNQRTSGYNGGRHLLVAGNKLFVMGDAETAFNNVSVSTRAGTSDVFLSAYDFNGNHLWTRMIGSNEEEYLMGARLGSDGKINIYGTSNGDFDGHVNTNPLEVSYSTAKQAAPFVARFDQNGNKEKSFLILNKDFAIGNLELNSDNTYTIAGGETLRPDPHVAQFDRRWVIYKVDLNGNVTSTDVGPWFHFYMNLNQSTGTETYMLPFPLYKGGIGICEQISKNILSTWTWVSKIRMPDRSTASNSPLSGSSVYQPNSMVVDSHGTVFIADRGNHKVKKVVNGQIVDFVSGISYPGAMAIDSQDNLYVAEWTYAPDYINRVKKISPNGNVSAVATLPGNSNIEGYITAMALDSSGYVVVSTAYRVYKIVNGVPVVFVGAATQGDVDGQGASARFFQIQDMATDPFGNIWLADSALNHAGSIKVIDTAGNVTTLFTQIAAGALAIKINGIYFTDRITGNINFLNYNNMTITIDSILAFDKSAGGHALVVDTSGSMYVDYDAYTVIKISE